MLEVSDIRYPLIARAVFGQPWAVTPEMLQTICSIVKGHMVGRPPDTEFQMGIGGVDFQAIVKQAASAPKGSVAVLPLFGVMSQRMNMMSNMSGGTSTDQFAGAFQALARDPAISAIVIDVDSPGGAVAGTGSGIVGQGVTNEDLRVTCADPTGGNLDIIVTYFLIAI